MQRLDRAPSVSQARGQVIEQFRVRRPLAKLAEIAGCAHDSLPEVKCPNAIGDHASGERIVRAGDRLGQLQPAARSEEHTSELQSPDHLVCRLLLEKKKK